MAANPFICNGMNALEVIEQIKAQGADLRVTREAVFYFYGKDERLQAFQQGLERLGFAVDATRTEPGRIARTNVAVTEDWLREIMPKLCALAAAHSVDYDGWEASIPEAQPKH